jgi:hypothetical protein
MSKRLNAAAAMIALRCAEDETAPSSSSNKLIRVSQVMRKGNKNEVHRIINSQRQQ